MSDFVWAIDNYDDDQKVLLEKYSNASLRINAVPQEYESFRYERVTSPYMRNLIIRNNIEKPWKSQIFSSTKGGWIDNPDMWHKIVVMEEDHEQVSPSEAYNYIEDNCIDDNTVKFCKYMQI